MITPPVCLAVFAGAAIAGANMWETAIQAMKLGTVAYILPWIIIFQPGVMMVGAINEIIFDTLCAVTLFSALFALANPLSFKVSTLYKKLF